MASISSQLILVVVSLCVLITASEAAQAITCTQVQTNVASCLNYARNGGTVPQACCNGVKRLNSIAVSTTDRQAACRCLLQILDLPGINAGYAASIPGKCGVNIGFKIAKSTDCSKVK